MQPLQSYWIFVGLCVLTTVNSAPNEDIITSLPGLKHSIKFKQYSGYLDAMEGRKLHYWFVESELNSTNAPLVLWMNGGPGCSSVYGLLSENGPFRVNYNGKTLHSNPFSWNLVANVLYLEAPAGVGFSYLPSKNYTTDDNMTALNNYQALLSFFTKFPEFKSNDFYITGESYGGYYVPTLSVLVALYPDKFNFKGFVVGNGLHSRALNANSAVFFARNHGLFDEEVMTALLKYCCNLTIPICNFYNVTSEKCGMALGIAAANIAHSGINPYGIYKICEKSQGTAHYLSEDLQPLKIFLQDDQINQTVPSNVGLDPPCVDSKPVREWINQAQVREALHIPTTVQPWEACSAAVSASYISTYLTMNWHYRTLLTKVRALVYHGDTDLMCSFQGGEWFVTSLGREVLKDYSPWTYKNQTAGFYKEFSNITYVTVLGAGHMVPTDRPGPALKLISNFLYNKQLD